MTFDEWLHAGQEAGWCGEPTCDTHGSVTALMTPAELDRFEEGGDPCVYVVRIHP